MNNKVNLTKLLVKPVDQWKVYQVVVFDWYDGPRQGIAALEEPCCEFVFDLIAENQDPDDLDDRYFRLKELPHGTVEEILRILQPLGDPASQVWVPVWQFGDEKQQSLVEEQIDSLLAKALPTSIVVRSRDMLTFLGCWDVEAGTADLPEPLAQLQT